MGVVCLSVAIGNWQETRQEWLAQVASADITKLSPVHSVSPPKKKARKKHQVVDHTPINEVKDQKPDISTTVPQILPKEVIKPVKYYNNPEKCQVYYQRGIII